jgi:ABC-type polysaccharide/polyol phosphate export permease
LILSLAITINWVGALQLIAVLFLTWILGVSLGFSILLKIRDATNSMYVTDIVYVLLVYIMPVYYPISLIPGPYRFLTGLSPVTHAAKLARASLGLGAPFFSEALSWMLLLSWASLFLAIAVCKSSQRENNGPYCR